MAPVLFSLIIKAKGRFTKKGTGEGKPTALSNIPNRSRFGTFLIHIYISKLLQKANI